MDDAFFTECDEYWQPGTEFEVIYKQLASYKYRELTRGLIKYINNDTILMCHITYFRIGDHLGSGQFGSVSKGVWKSPTGPVDVAIKTLNNDTSENEKVKFLQEAAIMGQFRHPNIVKLHGVVTTGEPVSSYHYFTSF